MAENSDILIGIDAGTSVIKAVAFGLEGEQLAVASTPNRIEHVAQGGVEQDMAWTWQATAQTLRDLGEKLPDLPARTAAISVTAQGDGTWLIDAAGAPVAPAMLWLDPRSGPIVEALRGSATGEQIYQRTGTGLTPSLQSGQLKWLAKQRPELLARAATALHCKDWLYFNCCGERATDPTEGVATYGDYVTRRYSDEVLELLELSSQRRLLPEIVDGSRHYGRLTQAAAAATGLTEGLPVVLGPVDFLATALGGGLYEPDRTIETGFTIVGSTGMHLRTYHSVAEITLRNQAGYTLPLVGSDGWAGVMSNMAATLNIDWLLGLVERLLADFGQPIERKQLLAKLDQQAGAAEPGKVLYHPFIAANGERGPFVNPRARAQFLGLSTQVEFADLLRGVYEGLGLAARDCYQALGHRPDQIRVGGGAMRSATMRRILAASLGVPLQLVEQPEAGAAGAAMIACLALGHDADLASVCRRWVNPKFGAIEQPDPALTQRYERLFEVYRAGYGGMPEIWRALDELRSAR